MVWWFFFAFLWFFFPYAPFLVTSYIPLSWNKEMHLLKSNFLSSQMKSHSFSPSSLPLHKAKWVQLNGKTLQVLKNSLGSDTTVKQEQHINLLPVNHNIRFTWVNFVVYEGMTYRVFHTLTYLINEQPRLLIFELLPPLLVYFYVVKAFFSCSNKKILPSMGLKFIFLNVSCKSSHFFHQIHFVILILKFTNILNGCTFHLDN